MARQSTITRRKFLKSTAAITAGAVAIPQIIPATALGNGERPAPSDRIVVGWIGTGDRGTGVMHEFLDQKDVEVVAVCDVKKWRRDRAKTIVDSRQGGTGCAAHAGANCRS